MESMENRISRNKKAATVLELKQGLVANRAWFATEFYKKYPNLGSPSYAEQTASFSGINPVVQISGTNFYPVEAYSQYDKNAVKLTKPRKSAAEKYDMDKHGIEKLIRDYSALAGKLGSYQRQITLLKERVEHLENVLTEPV